MIKVYEQAYMLLLNNSRLHIHEIKYTYWWCFASTAYVFTIQCIHEQHHLLAMTCHSACKHRYQLNVFSEWTCVHYSVSSMCNCIQAKWKIIQCDIKKYIHIIKVSNEWHIYMQFSALLFISHIYMTVSSHTFNKWQHIHSSVSMHE